LPTTRALTIITVFAYYLGPLHFPNRKTELNVTPYFLGYILILKVSSWVLEELEYLENAETARVLESYWDNMDIQTLVRLLDVTLTFPKRASQLVTGSLKFSD
jgi:hypothetical protein